MKHSYK